MKRTLRWDWLVALVPVAPLLVALLAYQPLRDSRVIPLTGEWHLEGTDVPLKVPGRVSAVAERVKLQRSVTVDLDALGKRPMLIFGGAQGFIAEIVVNGHAVGAEGVPEAPYKSNQVGLGRYDVAPSFLHDGENTIEVLLWPEGRPDDRIAGIVDHRLYLGPSEVLRPYFDLVTTVQAFFELGAAFYLLIAMALLLALSRLKTSVLDRVEQRWAAAIAGSVALYLAGKSGLYHAVHLPDAVIPWSITLITLSVPSFLHLHLLRRSGWPMALNIAICSIHLLAQLLFPSNALYTVFIPYTFIILFFSMVLACWDFLFHQPRRSPLLLVSVACIVVSAVNDLLTDKGVLATPRLFTLAAADFGIMTTLVITGDFLRTLRENISLLGTLAEKNVALTAAVDRAEESTRLKSAFLANTSHELRTPLNSIINVPEGLLEEFNLRALVVCSACDAVFEATETFRLTPASRCPECGAAETLANESRWVFTGDAEAAVRYLKSIQTSGLHLRAVVDDILDFSKLEAGKMTLAYETCDVGRILDSLDLTMRPLAEQRQIAISIARPEQAVTIETDPLKLTQVLMNLASNALKFSEQGKSVEVRTQVQGETVRFEVQDHGIGIAEEDQRKIFESFRQVDSGHTRRFSGTGLGLAITKEIVELMGGTIAVKSTLGVGTTFTVVLPGRRVSS